MMLIPRVVSPPTLARAEKPDSSGRIPLACSCCCPLVHRLPRPSQPERAAALSKFRLQHRDSRCHRNQELAESNREWNFQPRVLVAGDERCCFLRGRRRGLPIMHSKTWQRLGGRPPRCYWKRQRCVRLHLRSTWYLLLLLLLYQCPVGRCSFLALTDAFV